MEEARRRKISLRLFQLLDADGSGRLEETEFCLLIRQMDAEMSQEQVGEVYRRYIEGSPEGCITADGLAKLIAAAMGDRTREEFDEGMQALLAAVDTSQDIQTPCGVLPASRRELTTELYQCYDEDQSGSMTLVEFELLMRQFDPGLDVEGTKATFKEHANQEEEMDLFDFYGWVVNTFKLVDDDEFDHGMRELITNGKMLNNKNNPKSRLDAAEQRAAMQQRLALDFKAHLARAQEELSKSFQRNDALELDVKEATDRERQHLQRIKELEDREPEPAEDIEALKEKISLRDRYIQELEAQHAQSEKWRAALKQDLDERSQQVADLEVDFSKRYSTLEETHAQLQTELEALKASRLQEKASCNKLDLGPLLPEPTKFDGLSDAAIRKEAKKNRLEVIRDAVLQERRMMHAIQEVETMRNVVVSTEETLLAEVPVGTWRPLVKAAGKEYVSLEAEKLELREQISTLMREKLLHEKEISSPSPPPPPLLHFNKPTTTPEPVSPVYTLLQELSSPSKSPISPMPPSDPGFHPIPSQARSEPRKLKKTPSFESQVHQLTQQRIGYSSHAGSRSRQG